MNHEDSARPRIVIADDHSGVVEQIISLLRYQFDVVAIVPDALAAMNSMSRLHPDVLLIDLSIPGMNALHTLRTLRQAGDRTAAVIMTAYEDPELAKAAITEGAMGFVAKAKLYEDLLPALRSAIRGSIFVSWIEPRGGTQHRRQSSLFR